MTTLDVDSLRIELMRDILDTEDIDVLKTVKRTLTRALAKVKERQVAAGRQRGRGGVYQQAGNFGPDRRADERNGLCPRSGI